jgi:signal transduction histidine kinase
MERPEAPVRRLPKDVELSPKAAPSADLLDIITSILRVEPLEPLFDKILNTVARNFNIKGMSLGMLDESTGLYAHKASYGYAPDVVKKIKNVAYTYDRMKSDLRDEFRISRNCYYVRVEDISMAYDDDFLFIMRPERLKDPRSSPDEWHELDYIDFVMTDKNGRWIGWLEITDPGDGKVPSKDVIDKIEILADLAGVAIENSKMYQEAVDSMNESKHYVDLITHELNNMVRPLEHLAKELKGVPELDPKAMEIVLNIAAVTRSMRGMIETVKRYSDVRHSKSVTLRPHDLREVIRRTSEAAKREITQKQFEVNFTRPPNECRVMADELINDMFMNIFLDSARRTGGHYVTVDVSVNELHDVYTVSIDDRGSTIPDEIRERVFSDANFGIGNLKINDVGLSLAALVAKRYDGIVSVRDRHPGSDAAGMSFEISLPKAK